MPRAEPIFVSKASYYNAETKKWVEGAFELRENSIQFVCDDEKLYSISLSSISGLEKRNSSFIYPSICIVTGKDKVWFSSFPNRDAVYNMIELFWRESLLSKTSYKTLSSPKKATSNLGKELLGILHESESSLVEAANALVSQGRQLEESEMTVADINSDLNVAEKFVRNMNFAQAVTRINTSDSNSVESSPVSDTVKSACYRVTFAFSEDLQSNSTNWEKGRLTVSNAIALVDENLDQRLLVQSDDIEKIQVLTPWELRVDYSSDWISKHCYVMCPQLSRLLLFLNYFPMLKNKVVFENDNIANGIPGPSTITTSTIPLKSEITKLKTTTNRTPTSSSDNLETLSADIISEEDMEEISNMISNLKTLASDVKREQQSQLEKIDSLVTEVENTELRINADSKKIKKIT